MAHGINLPRRKTNLHVTPVSDHEHNDETRLRVCRGLVVDEYGVRDDCASGSSNFGSVSSHVSVLMEIKTTHAYSALELMLKPASHTHQHTQAHSDW